MLQYLKIKDLALMDEVSLELEDGFTAVTGETGAGKSILLGALSFLAGARVEKSIIHRDGDCCEVEGGFFFPDTSILDALLESLGLPPCENGNFIIRRLFPRQKMPRVQVNGALTTLANLRTLGEEWIDFHGPGEPQKLFEERWQRALLDLYAKAGPLLEEYREKFNRWRRLKEAIASLRREKRLSPDEIDFMNTQIASIDQANPSREKVEKLERDYKRQASAQELLELASRVEDGLTGPEGVSVPLASLLQAARTLAEMDPEAAALADRLESVIIELEDLGGEYASIARNCNFDDAAVRSIEEEMDRWLELKRKYGPEVENVLEKLESLRNRISLQGDLDDRIRGMEAESERARLQLEGLAEDLRLRRQKAAAEFARKSQKLVNALGFRKAVLKIEIFREAEFKAHGKSSCRFLFAPNAGMEVLPLRKIASSGEIARVMLALKTVLARVDATPVLVFDEVDANVGGEIGRIVGDNLSLLGKRHQVFCITHLPQVAAKAVHHFVVAKEERKNSVRIRITSLGKDRDGRTREIARMVGDRTSASALKHAETLLRSPSQ